MNVQELVYKLVADFEVRSQKATQDLQALEQRTQQAAQAMDPGLKGKTGSAEGGLNSFAAQVSKTLGGLRDFGLAAQGVQTFFNTLKGLGQQALQMAEAAGSLETLRASFANLAQDAGTTAQALLGSMRSAAQGMISDSELMQAANNAFLLIGRDVGTKFPEWIQIAQAAAKATGQSVSFMLDSIVTGIGRGSPRIIDNIGLILKLDDANQAYARSLGKTVEELTTAERSQALMNAVSEAGARMIERVGDAGQNLSQRLGTLRARFQNLKDAAQSALAPALTRVIEGVTGVVAWFDRLQQSSPGLFQLLTVLGSAIGLVGALTTVFVALAPAVQAAGALLSGSALAGLTGLLGPLGLLIAATAGLAAAWSSNFLGIRDTLSAFAADAQSFFADLASQAVAWGQNLIAQYGQGILDALSSVLVNAMDSVGNAIADFLASFSPPRKGPLTGIVSWGRGLMNSYLQGMTEADLGLLQSATSQIQGVLQSLQANGAISEDQVIPALQNMRGELAELIAGWRRTGEVSEDNLARISQGLGEAGPHMAEYLRLQLQLATATDKVTAAQKDYDAAKQESDARMQEYQGMGIGSALMKVLENQEKARLKPKEEALEKAKSEAELLQESVDTQKAYIDALKLGVDLNGQQLALLDRMAKAMERMAQQQKESAEESYAEELKLLEQKHALGLLKEKEYLEARARLEEQTIDKKLRAGLPVDANLARLRELQAQLAGLAASAEEGAPAAASALARVGQAATGAQGPVSTLGSRLRSVWEQMAAGPAGRVGEAFERLVEQGRAGLGKLVEAAKGEGKKLQDLLKGERLFGGLSVGLQVFQTLRDVVVQTVSAVAPQFELLAATVRGRFLQILPEIGPAWAAVWNRVQQVLGAAAGIVRTLLQGVASFLEQHKTQIVTILTSAWQVISGAVELAVDLVTGVVRVALNVLAADWEGAWLALKQTAERLWADIQKVLEGAWTGIQTLALTTWDLIKSTIVTFADEIALKVETWSGQVVTTLETWAKDVVSRVEGLVRDFGATFEGIHDKILGEDGVLTRLYKRLFGEDGWFLTLARSFTTWGGNVIEGLVQGIRDKWSEIVASATGIVKLFIDVIKGLFGISSPSTVMRSLFREVMDGGVQGVAQGGVDLLAALNDVLGQFLSAASGWTPEAQAVMQAFAETVGRVTAAVGQVVELMGKLSAYRGVANLRGLAALLRGDIEVLLAELRLAAEQLKPEIQVTLQAWSETVGKVVEGVGSALDLLVRMGSYEWPEKPINVHNFTGAISRLVQEMAKDVALMADQSLALVTAWSQSVGQIATAMNATFDFLANLASYTGMGTEEAATRVGALLGDLDLILRTIIDQFVWWAQRKVDLASVATWTATVGSVVGGLLSVFEFLSQLREYTGITDVAVRVAALLGDLGAALTLITEKAVREQRDLSVVSAWTAAVGAVVSGLAGVFDVLGSLREYTHIEDIAARVADFVADLHQTLVDLKAEADRWQEHALDTAAAWAGAVGSLLGGVSSAFDLLASLREYTRIGDLAQRVADFGADLHQTLVALKAEADKWEKDALTAGAAWAQSVGSLLDGISGAFETLLALKDYVPIRNIQQRLVDFQGDLHRLLLFMEGLAWSFGEEGLKATAVWAEQVSKIVDAVGSAFEALQKLRVYGGGLTQVTLTKFHTDLMALLREMQKIQAEFVQEGLIIEEEFAAGIANMVSAAKDGLSVLGMLSSQPFHVSQARINEFGLRLKQLLLALAEQVGGLGPDVLDSVKGIGEQIAPALGALGQAWTVLVELPTKTPPDQRTINAFIEAVRRLIAAMATIVISPEQATAIEAAQPTMETVSTLMSSFVGIFTDMKDVPGNVSTLSDRIKEAIRDLMTGENGLVYMMSLHPEWGDAAAWAGGIGEAIQKLIDALQGLGMVSPTTVDLKPIFTVVDNLITGLNQRIKELRGLIELLLSLVDQAQNLGVGAAEAKAGSAPGLQHGGLVTQPGTYRLAEAGPELVLPAGVTAKLLGWMGLDAGGAALGASFIEAMALGMERSLPKLDEALQQVADRMLPHSPIPEGPMAGWDPGGKIPGKPKLPDLPGLPEIDWPRVFEVDIDNPAYRERAQKAAQPIVIAPQIPVTILGPVDATSRKQVRDLQEQIREGIRAEMPYIQDQINAGLAKATKQNQRFGLTQL